MSYFVFNCHPCLVSHTLALCHTCQSQLPNLYKSYFVDPFHPLQGKPLFQQLKQLLPPHFQWISVYVLTCLLLVNFELLSSNIAAICKKIFKTKLFFGNDYPPSPLSLTDMIEGGNFPKSCIVNNIVMLLTVSF